MRKRQIRQLTRMAEQGLALERQAAEITRQRWARLSGVPADEVPGECAPVIPEFLNGRELPEPAGGFLFVTDKAAYVAIETWSLSVDRGRNAPFLEQHRVRFADVRQVQVAAGAVCFWESDDGTLPVSAVEWDASKVRFTAMGVALPDDPYYIGPRPGLEVMRAIDKATTHLPAERRIVPD